ncbi:MAG: steroid delta-isomerase [Acidimicrobiia bacterium]|nr:steroid delta-isomerase [Acidimicrobiia bacterium]
MLSRSVHREPDRIGVPRAAGSFQGADGRGAVARYRADMAASTSTMRAVVNAYCEVFSRGDRAGYVGLYAPDAWIEDPVGSPLHHGSEAIGMFFDQSSSMADSIELRLTGPVRVAGGEAAFPMQARPTMGGVTFVVDIIDVMTFNDAGLITTMRAYWDAAEMRPADDE